MKVHDKTAAADLIYFMCYLGLAGIFKNFFVRERSKTWSHQLANVTLLLGTGTSIIYCQIKNDIQENLKMLGPYILEQIKCKP